MRRKCFFACFFHSVFWWLFLKECVASTGIYPYYTMYDAPEKRERKTFKRILLRNFFFFFFGSFLSFVIFIVQHYHLKYHHHCRRHLVLSCVYISFILSGCRTSMNNFPFNVNENDWNFPWARFTLCKSKYKCVWEENEKWKFKA